MTIIGMYRGLSTIVHKTLHWECSWISMFEVEAVPHGCILYVQIGWSFALCMRTVLLVESFDFCPSSQCSLVSCVKVTSC
jgi:hypothetical protein